MPSWDGDQPQEWVEARRTRTDRLQVMLPALVSRSVPVRALERGPVAGVGRLRMADGTTFLVTAAEGGGLGRLMRALATRHSVLVASWSRSSERLEVTLSGVPGRHPVILWVVGPDQPD